MNKHPQRVSSYPHPSQILKYEGIYFPISLKDICKFEKMNNLSINVFTIEKKDVVPIALSKYNFSTCINLLILSKYQLNDDDVVKEADLMDGDNSERVKNIQLNQCYHFLLITNLSRLLYRNVGYKSHKKWFCNRCLNSFSSEMYFKRHMVDCRNINKTKISVPSEANSISKVKNFNNKKKFHLLFMGI